MITFIGDIAFTGLLSDKPEQNNERFADVIPVLSSSELVFANLEVPVRAGSIVNHYKKLIHFSLPDPTEALLKALNISCVSLANNHIYDYTMPGLQATINILERLDIKFTGAGWLEKHIEPVILYVKDQRIAFISYLDSSTNPQTENFPELLINYFDVDKVVQDIIRLREKADKIICSIHWGLDYSFYPTLRQKEIAKRLTNAGADIIMGHHPHTLQPFEKFGNTMIFYSLGGLTFGDFVKPGKEDLQALYRKTKKGIIVNWQSDVNKFQFVTTLEKKGNTVILTHNDFQKWSERKWNLFRLRHSFLIAEKLFVFKEKVADRIYDFFFGYYRKPFKMIFRISTYKKFLNLFK